MNKEIKENLVDKAYNALKKMIIIQEIKPGEYLNEKLLMSELNIGRTPLRQAILLLKNDNFVEGQPNKSPYVKEFSLGEAKELFETLMIIEKNITFLATLRITQRELEKIKKTQRSIDRAIHDKIFWKITDHNLEFHRLIAEASGNRFLRKVHQDIRLQAERLSYVAVKGESINNPAIDNHNQKISEQHQDIINCLENHDTKRIENIAIDHVKLFRDRIFNSLKDLSHL